MKPRYTLIALIALAGALSCNAKQSADAGLPRISFEPGKAAPVATDQVHAEGDAWRVEAKGPQSVRLFEVPVSDLKAKKIAFNALAKAEEVYGTAYLEMWVNFPGKGEFFSKALDTPLQGNMEWSHYSAPFFLRGGEEPDRIRLQLTFADRGTVYLKDVHIEITPQ